MHQHTLLLIIAIGNLIGSIIAIPTLIQSRRLETQRNLGLGKYKDGPETEIDCSITKFDFEYYFERCYDETTQWSANGNCVNGIKTEISELHRCMRPDTYAAHPALGKKGNTRRAILTFFAHMVRST